jgi:LPXTG-site transpeptidase (sortase) family protein
VVKAVRAALDEQHLLVWSADAQAAHLFASRRWDGALLPASGDSLMLVDSEVVASKQSQAVARDVTYGVTLADGERPRASLDVLYTNNARPQQRPDVQFVHEYRTFLRVLVPAGAHLLNSSGFDKTPSVGDECGRRFFAGQVTIPENSTTRVQLEYQLPTALSRAAGYDLLVQQQPGVPPGLLRVGITTPGAPVARAELQNVPGQHGHWRIDQADAALVRTELLPEPSPGGCGIPLVEAIPTAPPVALAIPTIRVDAQVVELGVTDDGEMEAPTTPDVVGWYRMSSRPGQPGNSVMSGHVDWGRTSAVFWGLRSLKKGDSIRMRDADGGSHMYAVEWNQSFPWKTAPVDRLVGPSADSVLTLITCEGEYDQRTRQYSERRVVRARLVN